MDNENLNTHEGLTSDNLKIDIKHVGIVIGSSGKTINRIIDDTGADIKIKKLNDTHSNCVINGTESQIKDAKQYISKIIDQTKSNRNNRVNRYQPPRERIRESIKTEFLYNMADFPLLPSKLKLKISNLETNSSILANTNKLFSNVLNYREPEIQKEPEKKSVGMVELK